MLSPSTHTGNLSTLHTGGRSLAAIAAVVLLALPTLALVQSNTSSIVGVVTDKHGRAVPRMTVTATNLSTNQSRVAMTDGEGLYTISLLPPGTYVVIVEAGMGFARSVRDRVPLPIGAILALDFSLDPEGVSVTAEAPVIPIGTPDVATNVNSVSLESLPVVGERGRNPLNLINFQPGVVNAPSNNGVQVHGSRDRAFNFTLDGVNNNNAGVGGAAQNISIEGIRELQVVNAGYSVEHGRSSGSAIINAVTKSGTNVLHGSAFFFFRDDSLQARGPFGGPAKPSFGQQQFGGSVGGPIRKDKAFFFASVDRLRENGATAAGVRDTSRRRVTNIFARTTDFQTLLTAKLNFSRGYNDQFVARYTLDDSDGISPGFSQGGKLQGPSNFQTQAGRRHQLLGQWTHSFNFSLLNEVVASYQTADARSAPLTNAPQVVYTSVNVGANFLADRRSLQDQFEVRDNLTWIRGGHEIKSGMSYQHVSLGGPAHFNLFGAGLIFVPCDFPSDAGCPGARADAEIPVIFSLIDRRAVTNGVEGGTTRGVLPTVGDHRLAVYAQDNFRVTSKLTLSLGLRWDYDSDFIGKGQSNPVRRGRRSASKKNVQPRLGAVWRLTRITIRGGHGFFFDQGLLETRQLELLADGERLQLVRSFGGTLASPFAQVGTGTPPDIFVTSNRLRLPYTFRTSAGVEATPWSNSYLSADLITARGRRYPRRVEINRRGDGSVADARFGSVIETQSLAQIATDQLIVKFGTRYSPRTRHLESLVVDSFYTLSRSLDEANEPLAYVERISEGAVNARELGSSPFDARHRFVFSGVFLFRGGVKVSPLFQAHSSVPFEIIQNHDFSEGIGAGNFRLPTVERNAGNRQVRNGEDVNRAIEAFNSDPSLVTAHGGPLGRVSPGLTFGRPYVVFNLRLSKYTEFGESKRLTVGADCLNLFNHTNLLGTTAGNSAGLQNNVEHPDFGRPLGLTPGGVFGRNAPRSFQLFARFDF